MEQSLIDLLLSDLEDPQPFIYYDDIIERLKKMYLLGQITQQEAADHVRQYRSEMKIEISKSPILYASNALKLLIHCEQISPEFNYNLKTKKPYLNWLCFDPMTALWGMLTFDTTSNRYMRQCTAPGCSNFFHAKRETAIYCSNKCLNRAKVATFREQQAQRLQFP